MENYKKGKNVEEELTQDRIPIEILPDKFLWMHVKGGTKVPNVVEYAEKAFKAGEYRSVVWSGSGGGVPKTISCAEIMKRNFDVHQVTRLAYQKIEEYWDPVLKGLDPIVVTRQVPAIHIFLSLDEVDPKTQGYQKANVPTRFWPEQPKERKKDEDYAFKNKKNFNGGNKDFNQQRNRSNNNKQSSQNANNNRNKNKPKVNQDSSQQQPSTSSAATKS
jgi:ribonucleases P/MRP protein subunit RPP25